MYGQVGQARRQSGLVTDWRDETTTGVTPQVAAASPEQGARTLAVSQSKPRLQGLCKARQDTRRKSQAVGRRLPDA